MAAYDARPQPLHDAVSALEVASPYAGAEGVGVVVGESEGVSLVGKGRDRDDGAEDLLLGWDGMGWDGMGWDGMGWDEMG
jgi:hypothetical protein